MLLREALRSPVLTTEFSEFLSSWKEALCYEFSDDPHGYLGRKCRAIATTIADTPSFPDSDVIFAYLHPITSWSDIRLLPDHHSWGLAQPNLARIACFCQIQFGWDSATIAKKFSKLLYPGVAIQSLLKVRLVSAFFA